MKWRLFSGDNSEVDIKAVLSGLACSIAILIYVAYALMGLWFKDWPMPGGVRDITVALIIGGILGAGVTVFNQKLGVQGLPQGIPAVDQQGHPITPQEEKPGPAEPKPEAKG